MAYRQLRREPSVYRRAEIKPWKYITCPSRSLRVKHQSMCARIIIVDASDRLSLSILGIICVLYLSYLVGIIYAVCLYVLCIRNWFCAHHVGKNLNTVTMPDTSIFPPDFKGQSLTVYRKGPTFLYMYTKARSYMYCCMTVEYGCTNYSNHMEGM